MSFKLLSEMCALYPHFISCLWKVVETDIYPKERSMAQQILPSLRVILLVKITDKKKKIKP